MGNKIRDIKLSIGRKKLTKLAKQTNNKSKVISFNEASSIGILFNATQTINFEIIRALVKKLNKDFKKEVQILGYVHSKKMIDHYLYRKGFDFFSQKDLNWLEFPKKETESVNDFCNKQFDILINLSLENYQPLHHILIRTKAKLKVSKFFNNAQFADFLIDVEKNKEEYHKVRQEIAKETNSGINYLSDVETDIDEKALSEIQLNFLIEQVFHYLKILKSK
jgi:uncharacterized protein YciU (UPF0263 family)